MRSPPRSFKIEFKNRSAKSAVLGPTATEDYGGNISKPSSWKRAISSPLGAAAQTDTTL